MALKTRWKLAAVLAFALLALSNPAPAKGAECNQVWPYPIYPVHKQTNVPRTFTFRWTYFEPDKPWMKQETGRANYYANIYISTCTPLGQDPPLLPGDPNSYPTPRGCRVIGVCYSGLRDLLPWTELSYSTCVKWDPVQDRATYEAMPPLLPDHEYWWYVTTACENLVQFYDGLEAWRFHTASATSALFTASGTPVSFLPLRVSVPALQE